MRASSLITARVLTTTDTIFDGTNLFYSPLKVKLLQNVNATWGVRAIKVETALISQFKP